jgi:cytochrome P450
MPFGAGPRICIGNHFALMEAHLLVATIARRWRFRLAQHPDIVEEPLVTLRPRGGVHVEAVARR